MAELDPDVQKAIDDAVAVSEARVAKAIGYAADLIAQRANQRAGLNVGFGTVSDVGDGGINRVSVLLDDETEIGSYALNWPISDLTVGQRVLVMFTPPAGSVVLGVIGAP